MDGVSGSISKFNPPGLVMNLKVVPPRRTREPMIEVTRLNEGFQIKGTVPSRASRDAIVNAVRGVRDELQIRDDVKEDPWMDELPGLIAGFHTVDVGGSKLTLKERTLTLDGTVTDNEAKDRIQVATAHLKEKGITIANRIEVEEPPPAPPPVAETSSTKIPPLVSPLPDPVSEQNTDPPGNEKEPPVGGLDRLPPKITERHQVFFGTGEYHIRSSEKEAVEGILARVKANRGLIQIDGYADQRGDPETNIYLSRERAKRVRQYLVENGVDPVRIISVTGHGEQPGITYPEARKTEVRLLENSPPTRD
jgi:outer membrane protein OmpA-like peptidoglycan-associated protein